MLLTEKDIELRNAWGDFADELGNRKGGWDWFATLTFRDPPVKEQNRGWTKIGMAYSKRACDAFLNKVGDMRGMRDEHWMRAREFQKDRGVPHYHLLIGGVDNVRRDEAWEWWFKRYGFARILPYEAEKGARFYLCKYITKPMGEFEFSDNLIIN